VVVAAVQESPVLLWTAAGAFVGVVLQPDLDHDDGTISEHFVRSVSSIAQKMWWIYWYPYRRIMKHRSFLSHFPIVSTIIRLVYAFWWVYALGWFLPPAFINGIVAVDAIHWTMDARLLRRVFIQ
jgi:uncharacterized metal-binding protein